MFLRSENGHEAINSDYILFLQITTSLDEKTYYLQAIARGKDMTLMSGSKMEVLEKYGYLLEKLNARPHVVVDRGV